MKASLHLAKDAISDIYRDDAKLVNELPLEIHNVQV